jgi:tetratricopeptide (TPR) repeat protein
MARRRHPTPGSSAGESASVRAPNPAVGRVPRWAWGALIATFALTALAYAPAVAGPFFFDDQPAIVKNASIRDAWPPFPAFHPPHDTPVSGRPVVNYSFALNNALADGLGFDRASAAAGGWRAASFRLTNLAIHFGCAVLLFALIRRTMATPRVRTWSGADGAGDSVALAVSALWMVHPIQSEVVNYVTQRTESLMAICLLTTLHAAARAWDAGASGARARWMTASVGACLVGMGTKEVMVVAPLLVLLYDRAFHADRWRDLRSRFPLYVGLLATTGWMAYLQASDPRAGTVGFSHGIPWYRYLYSQAWAIGHYLQLSTVPVGLVSDYGDAPVRGWRGVPGLLVVGTLGALTLTAWRRSARWGWAAFAGAWFFLILAPSSSVVPIVTEIAAERRFYLPLAAVLLVIVIAGEQARQRFGVSGRQAAAALAGVIAILAGTTFSRSRVYADPETLWRDAIAKVPTNPRAWEYLAMVIWDKGESRRAETDSLLRIAIAIDSTHYTAYANRAEVAIAEGRRDDARALLEQALRIEPAHRQSHGRLGGILLEMGDVSGAIRELEQAPLAAEYDAAAVNLARAYLAAGRSEDAIRMFRVALDINPARPDVLRYLGTLLIEGGRPREAVPLLERATSLEPVSGLNFGILSLAYAAEGQAESARSAAGRAADLGATDAKALLFAARAFLIVQPVAKAADLLNTAAKLSPSDPEVLTALGFARGMSNDAAGAADAFRRALVARPGHEPALRGLAALVRR